MSSSSASSGITINSLQMQIQESFEMGLKPLPLEIFQQVLSYLDPKSRQSAVGVNKLWCNVVIDTARRKELSLIKDFAKFLAKNLSGKLDADQIRRLLKIGRDDDEKKLNFANLIAVKSSQRILRENILEILKDLKHEDLKSLEELSRDERKPLFFENIFDLARIYKQIDEAKTIPDENNKSIALRDGSIDLTRNGEIVKAIELANTIPGKLYKCAALLEVCVAFTRRWDIDKAIELANTIPDEIYKSRALRQVVEALTHRVIDKKIPGVSITFGIKSGDIDKTIGITNTIPDKIYKYVALGQISHALARRDDIDKAIEIANTIPDDGDTSFFERNWALWYIFLALKRLGDNNKAREVVNMMSSERIKRWCV